MKPGQRLTRWWQEYVLGRLTTPQAIVAAARAETPPAEERFVAVPDPVDNYEWDTPARLRAVAFLSSASYAAQQQRADWQQCDPRMELLAARVVLRAAKMGIPLYVHSAFRTKAEQQELLRRGATKAPYPRSAHNIGEAFDLVHGTFQWNMTPREWSYIRWLVHEELRKINAKLPKARKLQLGFEISWDPAHFEVRDFRERIRPMPVQAPVRRSPSVAVTILR